MIRYLQRKKFNKGFTIIELIVVVAILGALTAIIVPSLNNERSRIEEARGAARDFYAAAQTVMTKFSLYDAQLSPAYTENNDLGIMRYYTNMSGNYPYDNGAGITNHDFPAATSLYITLYAKNDQVQSINTVSRAQSRATSDPGFFAALSGEGASTEFGKLFTQEINDRISFRDGYYYARIDFTPPVAGIGGVDSTAMNNTTVKVAYTAYTRTKLPTVSGTATNYTNNNLYFGENFKLNCGVVCGTCAPEKSNSRVGIAGSKLD